MKKNILILASTALMLSGCCENNSQPTTQTNECSEKCCQEITSNVVSEEDKTAIINEMNQCAEYWNQRDFAKFISIYEKSDSIKFIGSKGVVYGWDGLLNTYEKGYPDFATSGTLKYDFVNFEYIGSKNYIFCIGKFNLEREKVTLTDIFH